MSDDGPPRRWPARVYGAGNEPDPRYTMANERTFLAWIRTALAMLAAATALIALDLSLPAPLTVIMAMVLALIGMLCAYQAWTGWAQTEHALRHNAPLPSGFMKVFVAAAVAAVAVVLLVASALSQW
ncbi:MAG: hypothetical protein JWP10_1194 [Nocardioidaceae bacterium]|nr:hypothetical protein [Nocardioidaceae bacterium]